MSDTSIVALRDAIRNPDNPNHMMVIKPAPRRMRVYAGDTLLADSTRALRVMELGKSVYDPVIYFPEEDVVASLGLVDKSTHCPIKGDASYVSLDGEEIGWAYKDPIPMSRQLKGHHAFWPSKSRLVEGE
ncbi:DUF427 domain-containing protein [Roseibium sp.]|uniref:DUF427 domain-containing protein n=1 Tax=Roseibium sp. TaxID=1936156 RepID=UPI003B508D8A